MKYTYYGHASFSIEVAGKHLLFDPFISGNPLAKNIDVSTLKADFLLLSHGHGDHVADAANIAKRTNALCIGAAEIAGWLQSQGIERAHGMNHGGPMPFDFGTLRCVNAVHSSSLPDGSYGGNPLGFVICTDEGNFYYSGDTGLTLDMKLIPMWAKLDFAILPIGSNFTMDAADAAKAAEFIECDKIIGVHYNTFPPIQIDVAEAKACFEKAGKQLLLPAIGETIEL